MNQTEGTNKAIDFTPFDTRLTLHGISGIDFLLMMVPAIGAALTLADPNTTVSIRGQHLARLDVAFKDPQLRSFLWINRKHALTSHSSVLITVTTTSAPLSRSQVEAWFRGDEGLLSAVSSRGLLAGLEKCRGLLAIPVDPQAKQFSLVLVLPT